MVSLEEEKLKEDADSDSGPPVEADTKLAPLKESPLDAVKETDCPERVTAAEEARERDAPLRDMAETEVAEEAKEEA